MPEYLKIDTSFSCRIRTGRFLIASQADVPGPQLVPAKPMPGRRLLRIINNGVHGMASLNVFVVVGDASIRWNSTPDDIWGYGLQLHEFVDLPVDDSVLTYAMAAVEFGSGSSADLRTIEFA